MTRRGLKKNNGVRLTPSQQAVTTTSSIKSDSRAVTAEKDADLKEVMPRWVRYQMLRDEIVGALDNGMRVHNLRFFEVANMLTALSLEYDALAR